MLFQISEALILGLIGGIIPGPVMTAVFTQTLQTNFIKSIKLIFYAMLVELVIGLISLFILSSLDLPEEVFRVLSIIGTGVLVMLAMELWKTKNLDTGDRTIFTPIKLISVIVTNGLVWTFWISVVAPSALKMNENIPLGDFFYVLFVVIGVTISTFTVGYTFSKFRNYLAKPKVITIVMKTFSLIFIYFAVRLLFQ